MIESARMLLDPNLSSVNDTYLLRDSSSLDLETVLVNSIPAESLRLRPFFSELSFFMVYFFKV